MGSVPPNETTSLIVTAEDVGSRLDRCINRHYTGASFALIAKLLRKGAIRLNQKRAKISDRVARGDLIKIPPALIATITEVKTEELKPLTAKERKALKSWVIKETDDYLVINKPTGLAVQGGTKLSQHLDLLLRRHYEVQGINPRLVHRLDKETSGVMVIAKTLPFATHMTKAFKARKVKKVYLAILAGGLKKLPATGTIDLPLKKVEGPHGEFMVGDHLQGDKAITDYEVLDHTQDLTYIELRPLTGRTHQLRVHMKENGAAILGDDKYGKSRIYLSAHSLPKNLYLHAHRLSFDLPDGGLVSFEAPLPEHFHKVKTLKTF